MIQDLIFIKIPAICGDLNYTTRLYKFESLKLKRLYKTNCNFLTQILRRTPTHLRTSAIPDICIAPRHISDGEDINGDDGSNSGDGDDDGDATIDTV